MKHCLTAALLGSLVLFGCSQGNEGPPLEPVEGTVLRDGKPLANAAVTLIPIGSTHGQGGSGFTDASGAFVISTPDQKRKGAAIGDYQVIISKYVKSDGSDFVPTNDLSPMDAGANELLPPKYSDVERTTLTAKVPAGGAKLEFKLLPK